VSRERGFAARTDFITPVKSIACAADPEFGTQSHVDLDSPDSDSTDRDLDATVSVSFGLITLLTPLTTSSILPEETWAGAQLEPNEVSSIVRVGIFVASSIVRVEIFVDASIVRVEVFVDASIVRVEIFVDAFLSQVEAFAGIHDSKSPCVLLQVSGGAANHVEDATCWLTGGLAARVGEASFWLPGCSFRLFEVG
jgi:hypothetical protein